MNEKDIKRFWSKVEITDGCWLWHGNWRHKGYGAFWHSGRTHFAHRVSYWLAYNNLPSELFVCHHCDNPACVNPAHLFLGTNLDNVRDMQRKGRLGNPQGSKRNNGHLVSGERNGKAICSDEVVEHIRYLHTTQGLTAAELAKRFGYKPKTISQWFSRRRMR